MALFSIGVDLGGTNFRAAAIGQDGTLLDKISGSTNSAGGREAIVDSLVNAVVALRDRRTGDQLAGTGIAVPGFIVIEEGRVLVSPNLPALDNFRARDAFQDRLKAPVILENDANAAALGEKWMGAGRDVNDLILLTLGTGIGGGIICDGKVVHGYLGMAAELGHITVDLNGTPCGCGNTGCLEKHASATAVATMARHLSLGDNLTSEDVYKLATRGNAGAKRVFECMGQALGIGLATYIQVFNFPLYLLSGGPLAAWDLFSPAMFREIERRSFNYRACQGIKPTRVEKALLGGDAGLFGAAYLPFQAMGSGA
jgi:glucokinase